MLLEDRCDHLVSIQEMANVQDQVGDALELLNRDDEAWERYLDSQRLRTELKSQAPLRLTLREDLIRSQLKLAFLDKKAFRFAEASERYRKVLQMLQQLEADGLFQSSPSAAAWTRQANSTAVYCQGAARVLANPAIINQLNAKRRPHYYDLCIRSFARRGDHSRVAQMAEAFAAEKPALDVNYYDAATAYARAVSIVDPEKDQPLREKYVRRAFELLNKALELGFRNYNYASKDTLLDPLRDRPELKAWLAELKKRAGEQKMN